MLVSLFLAACKRDEAALWQAGGRYHLTLIAQDRPALIPSIAAYHRPIRNTLVLALTVDSIRNATVYGSYDGRFRGFAIAVGSPAGASREFQARMHGDTVRMEL